MFGTYAQALAHLNAFTDYERMASRYSPRAYNLRRMRRLVAALGHPERAFRSLHIAGTKGKGSVAHLAEAILREAGYRTGLYTSPHLVDMLERIRVGGRSVSPSEFVWAMNRMGPHLRRLRPTYFETMTAAAFLLFARRRVDYAVVEVGLGGRLDATNVIRPAACAVTTIDYDHTDKLGTTLAAIAREKAGIVKPGVPVVSSPQRPAALREIRLALDAVRSRAEPGTSPKRRAAPGGGGRVKGKAEPFRPTVRRLRRSGTVLEFTVEGAGGRAYRCRLDALGDHQAVNAATAIALVEAAGVKVGPGPVRRAFRRVRLPGRIEVLGRRPWVVVDTAHNPVAARALAGALRRLPRRRLILVFGASADKDFRSMLRALSPEADVAVFTRARTPRAADPEALARHAGETPAVTAPDVGRALDVARALVGPSDALVVTGSFYVAGEALALLRERP